MNTGLVLEGGAMRGMYTAGVLDVFLENGISFDKIAGVSAGALFGVNFLSKQKGRVIRYNKRFNSNKNYMGLRPLLREGNIVSTTYAYDEVPRRLDPFDDETYKKSKTPFYAVITNFDTAKAEYIQIKSVFEQMDTLRASGSMPFVSRPVEINGQKYLDGAVADSIPYKFLSRQSCDKLIVVLTRNIDFRRKPISPFMTKLFYGKNKLFAECLSKRHEVYNNSVAELRKWEQDGRAFVIRPSKPIEIGRTEKDPQKLEAVYELGIYDAKQLLPALLDYVNN